MTRVPVADEADFDDVDRRIVTVDGAEVGVFELDGEFYAIANVCPHQYGPVAEGTVRRQVVADVPDVGEWPEERYDEETDVVRCPCHGWGFDIATGRNVADPENAPAVTTYDVVLDDGTVYLEL